MTNELVSRKEAHAWECTVQRAFSRVEKEARCVPYEVGVVLFRAGCEKVWGVDMIKIAAEAMLVSRCLPFPLGREAG
ncbi:hypothetical protein CFAM422_007602 [Trichoderma lentiforme]|uniref:Uncharacterized protein n=1 Tax=Trichoderma lentiforme TaxID=1567552 RepID=A0A9P4XCU0_9HYPO|nr:hypothetical protein CFAM422_007602 [Trichoderma lentiforme]